MYNLEEQVEVGWNFSKKKIPQYPLGNKKVESLFKTHSQIGGGSHRMSNEENHLIWTIQKKKKSLTIQKICECKKLAD